MDGVPGLSVLGHPVPSREKGVAGANPFNEKRTQSSEKSGQAAERGGSVSDMGDFSIEKTRMQAFFNSRKPEKSVGSGERESGDSEADYTSKYFLSDTDNKTRNMLKDSKRQARLKLETKEVKKILFYGNKSQVSTKDSAKKDNLNTTNPKNSKSTPKQNLFPKPQKNRYE